jgi:hypothetical protein
MSENIGVRPKGDQHELFIGGETLLVTDNDLLYFSRLIPTYVRQLVADMQPASTDQIEPIAPVPVKDVRLNEDLHRTQVHLSIDDTAGGSFDYALDLFRARTLGERLIARVNEIESAAKDRTSH